MTELTRVCQCPYEWASCKRDMIDEVLLCQDCLDEHEGGSQGEFVTRHIRGGGLYFRPEMKVKPFWERFGYTGPQPEIVRPDRDGSFWADWRSQ